MGTVVALDTFRRTVQAQDARPKRPKPELTGSEIWGRDYTHIESIVFGLLKAREVVTYYDDASDAVFDHLCMEALECAYKLDQGGLPRLKEAIRPLKEWLLEAMTEDNKRDMSWALVLLDLIEKSPARLER